MIITVSFVGDIMLGRFVAERYSNQSYQLVSPETLASMKGSIACIANLESPVVNGESEDSLKFAANSELLEQFRWVDCFSLSNNHINDFGSIGMKETLDALTDTGINCNGLFKRNYTPFLIEQNGEHIAVITCADMMNYEFSDDCPYKTLRVNKPNEIISYIKEYKSRGFFVILYAHVGMLFTRYPNPIIRDFLHRMIDEGADCIITAHPHCLGGYEYYKEKLLVYSLGDFLMDGASYRRREAGILSLNIQGCKIIDWFITPVFTDDNLSVHLAQGKKKAKMQKRFQTVSDRIKAHDSNYKSFYKWQYKKELFSHSMSTLYFEYHRRGLGGLFRTLFKRIGAVGAITKRLFTDRSNMSYDADAVSSNNISTKDIR